MSDIQNRFGRGIESFCLGVELSRNDVGFPQIVLSAELRRVLDSLKVVGLGHVFCPISIGLHVLETGFVLDNDFHAAKRVTPLIRRKIRNVTES